MDPRFSNIPLLVAALLLSSDDVASAIEKRSIRNRLLFHHRNNADLSLANGHTTTGTKGKKKKKNFRDAVSGFLEGCATCLDSGSGCVDCLDSGDVWQDDSCRASCNLSTESGECVQAIEGFGNTDVCDFAACFEMDYTDCASCTGTVQSDGATGCYWFPGSGLCDSVPSHHAVDNNSGLVVEEIEDGVGACDGVGPSNTWCGGCVDNGGAWEFLGGCLDSCPDDSPHVCYSHETFPRNTREEICAGPEADFWKCDAPHDCNTCVNTVQSDGTTNCLWYEAYGFCDSIDYSSFDVFNEPEDAGASACGT